MPPEPTAIRLLSPLLHGTVYLEPGSVVEVEPGRAASLIRDGYATAARPHQDPAPAPEAPPEPEARPDPAPARPAKARPTPTPEAKG